MKNLLKSDIALLKEIGYSDEDMLQIDKAFRLTTYICEDEDNLKRVISASEARILLGTRDFLSGLARSAFHWSSCRYVGEGDYVYFDSSRLFRQSV